MNCREMIDSLDDFVSGELPPERQQGCKEHLDVCPPCVAVLESYQVTIRLARQLPPAPVPDRLWKDLGQALGGEAQPGAGGA